MIIKGYISDYDGQSIQIIAPFEEGYLLEKRGITECEIRLDDGRTISADQRKKIYATMRDISLWSGHAPDEVKALMKYDYIAKTGADYFSLSNVDMTTAREFLEFLLDFCVQEDIPLGDALLDRSPDIARSIYACLANKRCCLCGSKAELHHVDAVGRGRNRKDIIHVGMRVLPLCRKHHSEAHAIGRETFNEKYHIFGIKLNKDLCRIWKVKSNL